MKTLLPFLFLSIHLLQAQPAENPGWGLSPNNDESLADFVANHQERADLPSIPQRDEPILESADPVNGALALQTFPSQPTISPRNVPPSNEADTITPAIAALAHGLRNDPLLIFQYVRNQIRYEHYYGCKKSAHLTLLEGGGNDYDQCALTVALLRAAGHSASYGHAPCMFSWDELRLWWGLTTTPYAHLSDAQFATKYGITDTSAANISKYRKRIAILNAAYTAGQPYIDPFTYQSQEWFSIACTYVIYSDGTNTYNICPAWKNTTHATLPNWATYSGYNKTQFLSDAGGSVGSPDYVLNLNESAINQRLSDYTNNLLQALRVNHDSADINTLLGKPRIVTTTYASFQDVPEMYIDTTVMPWITPATFTLIPTSRMVSVSITAGTYNYSDTTNTTHPPGSFISTLFQKTITAPSLAGKKISLSSTASSGTFRLDEATLNTAFSTAGRTSFDVKLQWNHGQVLGTETVNGYTATPVTERNEIHVSSYKVGATYAFPYCYSDPTQLLRKRQDTMENYRRQGIADTDHRVISENLNIIGLQWMQQQHHADTFLGPFHQIIPSYLHVMGRVAQESSIYLDMPLNFNINLHRSVNSEYPFVRHSTTFASAMEHGILEQTQSTNYQAASTVRMIRRANQLGQKIYRATSSNFSSVVSQLTGYSAAGLSRINNHFATANKFGLLPKSGNNSINQWAGYGFALESSTAFFMEISGGYNGGYSGYTASAVNTNAASSNYRSTGTYFNLPYYTLENIYHPGTTPQMVSYDPVDLANGAFLLDKTDLTLGAAAPCGLSFSRHYNSTLRYDNSAGLGYGWTHSANAYLTKRSAPLNLLAGANTYQAAPLIVAALVSRDLLNEATTAANAKSWATGMLVAHWAIEQMRYNSTSITLGNRNLEFIKMPDGTFLAPPGLNLTLTAHANDTHTLQERHGLTYFFNASNKLATITDPHGNTQTWAYDTTSGKISTITDCRNRTLTFHWVNGRIQSITDGTGRSVSYNYTADTLTAYTDAEAKAWTYQYSASNQMVTLKDPMLRTLARNTYDSENRVIAQRSMDDPTREWTYHYNGYCNYEVNPQGHATCYFYDRKGRCIATADPKGNTGRRSYDGQDRSSQSRTPKVENTDISYNTSHDPLTIKDPLNHQATIIYDAQQRPWKTTDKRGKTTTTTYYAHHKVHTVTDPENNLTTYTYLTDGNLHTITDPENRVTTFGYDTWGQLNKITYHDTNFVTFLNNARGEVLESTDARSNTTTYTYNNRGQRKTTTLPPIPGQPAAVSTITYDDSGNIDTTTDARTNLTSYDFNALGDPTTTTLPAITTTNGSAQNNVITHIYDTRNWLEKTTDSLRTLSEATYHANKEIHTTKDPLARTTTFTYDANSQLTDVLDPLLRLTKNRYTARGENDRTTDALTKNTTITYDQNGNRRYLLNRRNKTYEWKYDDASRPTQLITPLIKTTHTTYHDDSQPHIITEPSLQTTTLTYDSRARLDTRTDALGTIQHGYDADNNLLTVTEVKSGVTTTIQRTYDERSRLKTYTNTHGETIGYQYDAQGNLTTLTYPPDATHPTGKKVHYTYNARNQLETVTDWNNRSTTYRYDRIGWLEKILHANGTTTTRTRDAAGQIATIKINAPDGKLLHLQSFRYDDAGQIVKKVTGPAERPYTAAPLSATYDDDNRLLTCNGQTIIHDDDGNMTQAPRIPGQANITHTYNARNQLTNLGSTSYTYDAEGHRITTTDVSGTTRYTTDPNTSLSRHLIIHHPDGSKTYNVHGLGLLYQITADGQEKHHHYDQVGSTILRSNATGAIIARAQYSAYGALTWSTGDIATPYLYNGQAGVVTDPNGLLCMRARYYNPHLRRFLNADPIGFSGGSNWYAYADGNPISMSDPFGLCAMNCLSGGTYGSGSSAFPWSYSQVSNSGHMALDGLGLIPVIGEAADGVGALWYLAEGNYTDAAIGAAAMIPFAGWGATGAKVLRHADEAYDAADISMTTLYRAVGPDELADVQNTGQLINRGSAEGKYFTTSAEHASDYAQKAVRGFGDPPYTTIRTQIPTSTLPSPTSVDGGIPAFVIPNNSLPNLKPTVLDWMALPYTR